VRKIPSVVAEVGNIGERKRRQWLQTMVVQGRI
jgi:hypothetical protein